MSTVGLFAETNMQLHLWSRLPVPALLNGQSGAAYIRIDTFAVLKLQQDAQAPVVSLSMLSAAADELMRPCLLV